MSQSSSGFVPTQQQHEVSPQNAMGTAYVLTEEERQVLKECNQESFRYRSAPLSVLSMAFTQGLISRGYLTASPRFGSIPKVVFAGMCGFMAGKISYMKTCQEKLKNLENSPLGEALRQRQRGLPPQFAPQNQSEVELPDQPVYEQNFQPNAEFLSDSQRYQSDYSYGDPAPFSSALSESAPTGASDISLQAPPFLEEDQPKKKTVKYEDLRSKNRENYEVILTQKADALLKPTAERDRTPQREVKKNAYGDTWDE